MRWLLIGASIACVAACGTSDSVRPNGNGWDTDALAGARFDSAVATFRQQSGIQTRRREVIDNLNDFLTVWGQLVGNRPVIPNPPDVDFNKYMIVLVSSGAKPTGGYCIDIGFITGLPGGLQIWVTETEPAANSVVNQVVTQPTDLRLIGRGASSIFFVEDRHTGRCS
jgi:hypothetical protein